MVMENRRRLEGGAFPLIYWIYAPYGFAIHRFTDGTSATAGAWARAKYSISLSSNCGFRHTWKAHLPNWAPVVDGLHPPTGGGVLRFGSGRPRSP